MLFGLDGSKVDVKRGVELLQKAADVGSLDAKGELAFRRVTLHWGINDYVPETEKELDAARKQAFEAALAGNPFALLTLSICAGREEWYGVEDKLKQEKLEEESKQYGLAGLQALKKRAEEGDVRAKTWLFVLGGANLAEDANDDAEQAKRWLREAGESRSAEAAFLLGFHPPVDHAWEEPEKKEDYQALIRAAEAGLPEAMLTAGRFYLMGAALYDENAPAPELIIAKDEDKGVELLSKAADAGLMSAALFLAKYYEYGGDFDGSEREPDPEKAIEWYIKATECETAKKWSGDELGQIMVKIGRYYLDRLYKTLESKKIYDQKVAKEARKWFYRAETEGYGSERWIKELDEIKQGVEEEGKEMGITIIE